MALFRNLVGAAALSFAASGAWAYTGNDLLKDCSSDDAAERQFCFGYVLGAGDGWRGRILFEKTVDEMGDLQFMESVCVPDNVTKGQVLDIALKHMKANPEHRHTHAAIMVATALVDAFPCPRG